MEDTLFIDFETRSAADITIGANVYAEHPSTEIMCMAWQLRDREYNLKSKGIITPADGGPVLSAKDELPADVRSHIWNGGTVSAWNAAFEASIWTNIASQKLRWVPVNYEQWSCSAAFGRQINIPSSLENAAKFLGLGQQKDAEGKALMMEMCRPCMDFEGSLFDSVENQRYVYVEGRENLQRLYQYCEQDVETEVAIFLRCLAFDEFHRDDYIVSEMINQRGVRIDGRVIPQLESLVTLVKTKINQRLRSLTGGAAKTVDEITKIKEWLQTEGVEVGNLRKETVESLLGRDDLPAKAREVISLRAVGGGNATSKLQAAVSRLSGDGRVRGSLLHCGASATGRFSGRGFQVHNIPRGNFSPEKVDSFLTELARIRRADDAWACVKSHVEESEILDLVTSSLRGLIVPSPGLSMLTADWNAIEVRVEAWLASEVKLLESYEQGKDIYVDFASRIFNIEPEAVTKDQRQVGKMAILGCGYGMGWRTFHVNAAIAGSEMTRPESRMIVKEYRRTFASISEWWGLLGQAAVNALEGGKVEKVGTILFRSHEGALQIRLPSGRRLTYHDSRVETMKAPWSTVFDFPAGDNGSDIPEGLKEAGVAYIPTKNVVRVPKSAMEEFAEHAQVTGIDLPEPEKVDTGETVKCVTYAQASYPIGQRKALYGGLLAENITQAVARDLLMHSLSELDADPDAPDVVLHVHDEIVCEGWARELDKLVRIMEKPPAWAVGLPLAVEGSVSPRYCK